MLTIPDNTTECAFHNKKGAASGICSGNEGIAAMKKVLESLDVNTKGKSDDDILKLSKKRLGCDEESCVISHEKIASVLGTNTVSKIKKEKFKPKGPWNDTSWLSNFNIDNVLDQWVNVYPGFVHIPFQMRDFKKKGTELATIDLWRKYREGMKSFGVVLNTDYSTGEGIHWFAIYGDFSDPNNVTLEYFNSSGTLPLPEIHDWLYDTKSKLEDHGLKVKVIVVSRIEHQKSDSECGVFALWYIYSRLNDVPYSYFNVPNSVTDDMMIKWRKHLFRKYE